jgi:predicted DNA-binding transcriptional regulator AlpA
MREAARAHDARPVDRSSDSPEVTSPSGLRCAITLHHSSVVSTESTGGRFLNTVEVAALTGMSRWTVLRYCKQGKYEGAHQPESKRGQWRIPARSVGENADMANNSGSN